MKEHESNTWQQQLLERMGKKEFTDEEKDMLYDFHISLQMLKYMGDSDLADYHLNRIQFTIRYFSDKIDLDK